MYNKKTVFWAACCGMLLFGIGLITLGSMAPDLREKFQLDNLSVGTIFSILPFGILAGSLVFGPICDRYGYKLILLLSILGMFAGFEGIAFLSSLTWLKVCIFIFAVSAGIINGATNAVVSDISQGSGARLSLLGVFFGLGALGMPFILGLLKNTFSSFQIVAAIGWLTLAVAIFYMFVKFPASKKALGFTTTTKTNLFKESFLYFLAFFLFFQGSIEAIVNNWTTTYLIQYLSIAEAQALFALSLYVLGLTVMRLLIGSVFRSMALPLLMTISLTAIGIGALLVYFAKSYAVVVPGLIVMGIGMAAGFPITMGLAGNRYPSKSGTAFSFILTISLVGNMLVNYLMGVISNQFGMKHYTTMIFAELCFMIIFCILIFRSQKKTSVTTDDVMTTSL